MKLERICIETGAIRGDATLRDFFAEAVRCNVPGLPYMDGEDRIIGRLSIRDVYKHMAVPDNLLRVVDGLGDQTDRLDLPEMKVMGTLALPAKNFLLENIPNVSPRSSIVKALALMELHNTSYIFLIDDGDYKGVVTRMVIARRMMTCVLEHEAMETSASP